MRVIFIIFILLLSFPLVFAEDCLQPDGTFLPCPEDEFDPTKMTPNELQGVDATVLIENWELLANDPKLQSQLTPHQLKTVLQNPQIQLDLSQFKGTQITSLFKSTYNFDKLTSFTQASGVSITVKDGLLTANGKTFNVKTAAASLQGNTALNVLSDGTVQIISQSAQTIDPDTLAGPGATYEIIAGAGGEGTTIQSGDGTFVLKEGNLKYEHNQLIADNKITITLDNGKDIFINAEKSPVSINGNTPNNININDDDLTITTSGEGFKLAYRNPTNQLLPYVLKGTTKIVIQNVGKLSEVVDLHTNSAKIRLGHLIIDENGRIHRSPDFRGFVAPAKTRVLKNGRLPFSQEYTWNGKTGEGRIFKGELDLTFPIQATQEDIAKILSEKLAHLSPEQLKAIGINLGQTYLQQGRGRASSRAQSVIDRARSLLGSTSKGKHCTAAVMQILFPNSNSNSDNNPSYSVVKSYEVGSRLGSGSGGYASLFKKNGQIGQSDNPNAINEGTHVQFTTGSNWGAHSELVTSVQSAETISYGGREYAAWKVSTIGAFNGAGSTYKERTRYITTAPVTSSNHHYNNGQKYSVLLRAQPTDTSVETYVTTPSQPTQDQYLSAANNFLQTTYNTGPVETHNPYITADPTETNYVTNQDYYLASLAVDLQSSYDEYDFWNSQYPREETEIITHTVNAEDFIETGITEETEVDNLISSVETGEQIIISKNNVQSSAEVTAIEQPQLLNVGGKGILVYPATIITISGTEMTVYLTDNDIGNVDVSNLEYDLISYKGTILV